MGMNTQSDSGYSSEINITPLIDVVLVLLIIFMVVSPAVRRAMNLDVPPESVRIENPAEEDHDQVVLTIREEQCPGSYQADQSGVPENCRLNLDGELLAPDRLPDRIESIFRSRQLQDRVLFLNADDSLNYELVMRVLDLAGSEVQGLRIGMIDSLPLSRSEAAGG
jgi:biopolymer transport protein TolR